MLGEKIRNNVSDRPMINYEYKAINVTISLGVAQNKKGSENLQQLKEADRALYKAKKNGKDGVVIA